MLIGSFINVLGLRYNSGLSVVKGRSRCFSCDKELSWYELIPFFSYVFLQGKCKTCKSKISLQYPVIELLTGLVFVGVVIRQYNLWYVYSSFENGLTYSVFLALYYFVVFSILIAITIYDYRHKIIPNSFVYAFIFLAILKLAFFVYLKYPNLETQDWYDILSPVILFIPFALLWLVSSGRWMGFGDAKLAFGIGALLGFTYGLGGIVVGFWAGALWSILLMLVYKIYKKDGSISMQSEIPFAPFLIFGTLLVFMFRLDILNFSLLFN